MSKVEQNDNEIYGHKAISCDENLVRLALAEYGELHPEYAKSLLVKA